MIITTHGSVVSPDSVTRFGPDLSARVFALVRQVSVQPDVRSAVEANHDNNRWWPTGVSDLRIRMLAAGWSTRVSYAMVDTYAEVISQAEAIGFDQLEATDDHELSRLVRPIGLPAARITYLRSLTTFLHRMSASGESVLDGAPDGVITKFASEVRQASYKVAQCAVLCARGYHCGVIPVDSGMVSKLAPVLGIRLPRGPVAHETLRLLLQDCVADRADDYRRLATNHAVSVSQDNLPTWWTHLVLIYFKRLYLNRLSSRLCTRLPVCDQVLDCAHSSR